MFKRLAIVWVLPLALMLAVSCGEYREEGAVSVQSPDGKVQLVFDIKQMPEPYGEGRNMYFALSYGGKQLLNESPLGMNFGEGLGAVAGEVLVTGIDTTSGTDEFDTPLGKKSGHKLEYHQTVIHLREKKIPAKTFDLIFRAYNEGVAFRYFFPEQEPNIKFPSAGHMGFIKEFMLVDELTGYYFPQDAQAYTMFFPAFPHNYEDQYSPVMLSEITRDSTAAMPLLVQYEGGPAICITEAAVENYSNSYLSGSRTVETGLVTMLVPLPGERDARVRGQVPFITPWRVIMIAERAGQLIESGLVLALNEPSKIEDASWIKPGKASWDWWSDRIIGRRGPRVEIGPYATDTYKQYIAFAAEAGLQYCLIDAGWYGADRDTNATITQPVAEIDMTELTRYAESLGIKLILWLNWENVQKEMDQAFPLYRQWGIAGVKIDYMDRDDQEMVAFYHQVLQKAAEHQLLVDFHGAYKPTGTRRTWPNLITREGVLGLEYNKWSELCSPEHDVTIPFTRMLVGPMDFTPGGFNNAFRNDFKIRATDPMTQGTRCHQLAMFVVYESPLQVLADAPVNYRGEKGFDFIQAVPTVWEDTRFLDGEVANYIVLARKQGNAWYLGAMTDWDAREVQVPLAFLGEGSWRLRTWADGSDRDAEAVATAERTVSATETLTISMQSGGGFAAILEPAQ